MPTITRLPVNPPHPAPCAPSLPPEVLARCWAIADTLLAAQPWFRGLLPPAS
jgi:hypothetical protein